jgi:exopolysaccharide/PEP-CTERM locus tyrosine autokinase
MSRIEKALEEAVRLRGAVSGSNAPNAPVLPENNGERPAFVPASPYLVTLTEQDSPISEEYRKLKAMVIKLTKRDSFRNLLMVTSSVSGEGKSITCLNLAVILAQEYSHTVLLIDADLRRPSLQGFLEVPQHDGLSDCLTGAVDLKDAIVKTRVPKLSLLMSGSRTGNPVELLSSPRMRDLLHEVKGRYRDRYVIIDTPPLLPYAETHALSGMVDGILFVVKEGASSKKSIREALDLLADTHVLGVVYNDVSAESLNGRYDYYYNNPYVRRGKGA